MTEDAEVGVVIEVEEAQVEVGDEVEAKIVPDEGVVEVGSVVIAGVENVIVAVVENVIVVEVENVIVVEVENIAVAAEDDDMVEVEIVVADIAETEIGDVVVVMRELRNVDRRTYFTLFFSIKENHDLSLIHI